MTAATPGQAAYEAYVTFVGLPLSDWPWEADDVNQALWDAVASTVAGNLADAYDAARKHEAAIAAQDARPALSAGPRDEALDVARGKLRRIAMGQERDPSVGADEALVMIRELLEQPQPAPELAAERPETRALRELHAIADRAGWRTDAQPAPELAAAMADRNSARNVVADILDHFTATGSGHTARVGQVQIAKWRKAAGLTS